ncbi:MAG TPA: SpoIID/LytB domain-containing protein [Candidatus Obscuribacterales bacterium]
MSESHLGSPCQAAPCLDYNLSMPDRLNLHDEGEYEDAEMAAAMAAVYAYMKAEAAQRAAAEPAATMRPWLAASLIEGVSQGRARIVTPPTCPAGASLWLARARQCFLSLCLAGCLAVPSAPQALAQEAQQAAPLPASQPAARQSYDSLESGKPTLIRVGLLTNAASLELAVPDGAQICDRATGALVASLPVHGHWTVIAQAGQLAFSSAAREPAAQLFLEPDQVRRVAFRAPVSPAANAFALPTAPPDERLEPGMPAGLDGYVVVPPQPEGIVGVKGRLYRGIVWVRTSQAAAGKVSAINILDLEDYLLSVVPAEMPSSWPMEALKAQAIVARSYAIANMGKNDAQGFDVKASQEDQVYPGIASETEATNEAVAATDGIVVKHQGRPAATFFHSTSGGFTELAEFVWGTQAPYLKSVPDYDDASPHFVWSRSFSPADLETKLSQSGRNVGQVLGIFILSRAPSGRARQLLVAGTEQTAFLTGDDVRRLLKLPSTNFNIGLAPDAYVLNGRGFGHGLGMSQWGARALAERGYNAAQILTYYYRDVSLDYL